MFEPLHRGPDLAPDEGSLGLGLFICAEVAKAHGLSLTELALGYVRSRWYVGSTIIGATTMSQLEENIAAARVTLDADTLAAIAAVQLRYPNPAG